MLLRRAEPEVAMILQELDAVLLRLDRVLLRDLIDVERADGQLVAARCARVLADAARHGDARLLGERGELLPRRFVELLLHENALDHAGPVAQDDERDLPVRTESLHPAPDGYLTACMSMEIADVAVSHDSCA